MSTCAEFYDLIQENNYMLKQKIYPCTFFIITPAIFHISLEFLASGFLIPGNILTPPDGTSTLPSIKQ